MTDPKDNNAIGKKEAPDELFGSFGGASNTSATKLSGCPFCAHTKYTSSQQQGSMVFTCHSCRKKWYAGRHVAPRREPGPRFRRDMETFDDES